MAGQDLSCNGGLGWTEFLGTIVDAAGRKPADSRLIQRFSPNLGGSLVESGVMRSPQKCLAIADFLFFRGSWQFRGPKGNFGVVRQRGSQSHATTPPHNMGIPETIGDPRRQLPPRHKCRPVIATFVQHCGRRPNSSEPSLAITVFHVGFKSSTTRSRPAQVRSAFGPSWCGDGEDPRHHLSDRQTN